MRLAARFATTWVTTGPRRVGAVVPTADGTIAVRRQIADLERACTAEGRDPASIDRLVLLGVPLENGLDSPGAFDDVASAYAACGVTDVVVHWPRDADPYRADRTVFERIFGG
jgi:hypothetical protein